MDQRLEKFLGFIPITFDSLGGLALTILPLIGSVIWKNITNQIDDSN
jgi:hypothetical protein